MHSGVGKESVGATTDLLLPFLGSGAFGVEEGALGALRMARMAPGEEKWALSSFGGKDEWNLIHKDTNKKMGELYTNYDHAKNQLRVEYMTSEFPKKWKLGADEQRSWGIGTSELMTLVPEALREYPNIDTLKFTRIGGVFKGRPMSFEYKIHRMPDGSVVPQRIKSTPGMSREPWRSPQDRRTEAAARAERRRQEVSAQPTPSAPPTRPPGAAPPYPLEPGMRTAGPSPEGRSAAWERYWNSINAGNMEETTRLYNEYIGMLTGRY